MARPSHTLPLLLAALVCVAFAIEAALQLAFDAISADGIFKAANYSAIAAVGAGCLVWPKRLKEGEEEEEEENGTLRTGLIHASSSMPPPLAPKLHYLTHLKTFLTFTVVT